MLKWTPSISSVYVAASSATQTDEVDTICADEPESDLLKSLKAASSLQIDSSNVDTYDDEVIEWHDNQLVWTKGNSILKIFDFEAPVSQSLFAFFHLPQPASQTTKSNDLLHRQKLFGPFAKAAPAAWTEEGHGNAYSSKPSRKVEMSIRAICTFLRDTLHIYFVNSSQPYVVHMPFRLRKAWTSPAGLIVERMPDSKEGEILSPLFYSLSDPHDEWRPVSQLSSSSLVNGSELPNFNPFSDSSQRILLSSPHLNQPLVVFDTARSTISLRLPSILSHEELQAAILEASTKAPQATVNGDVQMAGASILNPNMSTLDPQLHSTRKPSKSKRNLMDIAERETSMIMHGDDDQREQVGVLAQVYMKLVWQSGPSMNLYVSHTILWLLADEILGQV